MSNWKCEIQKPASVADFFNVLLKVTDVQGWAWRGEAKSHPHSKPALGRESLSEEVLSRQEAQLIARFRQRAGAYLTPNEIEMTRTIWGTLVLMQHYKAPTRLLDWTFSPWVAAYFASEGAAGDDGLLYGFRQETLLDKHGELPKELGAPDFYPLLQESLLVEWQKFAWGGGRKPWLIALQPSRAPARVAAQQSLFSVSSFIDLDHRDWIGSNLSQEDLKIIVLPKAQKRKVRRVLDRMNITAASLFPDLVGVGQSIHEILEARIPGVGPVDDWVGLDGSP